MTAITVKEYKRLFGVVCVGARDSYIFGNNNTIATINIKGRIKKKQVSCRMSILAGEYRCKQTRRANIC